MIELYELIGSNSLVKAPPMILDGTIMSMRFYMHLYTQGLIDMELIYTQSERSCNKVSAETINYECKLYVARTFLTFHIGSVD